MSGIDPPVSKEKKRRKEMDKVEDFCKVKLQSLLQYRSRQ